MRLPRDLTGRRLAGSLARLGYAITRQTGSHMRLTTRRGGEHHITIPDHDPLRPGTLSAVLRDVAAHVDLSREELSGTCSSRDHLDGRDGARSSWVPLGDVAIPEPPPVQGSAKRTPAAAPTRFAGDLWTVFSHAHPDTRCQRFLQRGRPSIKSLIESLLLHPKVVIPTEDYLNLAILVSTLGERAVLDMLEAQRLSFVRLRGSLAYVGNGAGLISYELGPVVDDRKAPPGLSPHATSAAETIAWALGGLNVPLRDSRLADLALEATLEASAADLVDAVRDETYLDVLNSPELRAHFAIRNTDMAHLAGIDAKGHRLYGGPDCDSIGDEIDTVLMLGAANLELRLSHMAGAEDLSTVNPIGRLLKAKAERRYGLPVAESFIQLREIAGIPDIGESVLRKQVGVATLLKLSSSKSGLDFQLWFHDNCRTDPVATGREYVQLLESIPGAQKGPVKALRWLVTSALGAIEPVSGTAASALDSFVLDRLLRGHSPKYFVQALKKLPPNRVQRRGTA